MAVPVQRPDTYRMAAGERQAMVVANGAACKLHFLGLHLRLMVGGLCVHGPDDYGSYELRVPVTWLTGLRCYGAPRCNILG